MQGETRLSRLDVAGALAVLCRGECVRRGGESPPHRAFSAWRAGTEARQGWRRLAGSGLCARHGRV